MINDKWDMNNLEGQLNKSIKLAHLKLAPEEKKTLLADLEKILGFVQIIKKAEEKGKVSVEGKAGFAEREFPQIQKRNALAEDVIEPFDNTEGLIKEIPQKKDNLIKVKKI